MRNSPIPSMRPPPKPVMLQGKGQTISLASILAMATAFGGYQLHPQLNTAAGQDIAVMQSQIKNLSESMASLEDKVDTQIATSNERLKVLVRLEASQEGMAELLKETRDELRGFRRRTRRNSRQ